MASIPDDGRSAFHGAIAALESEIANVGVHLTVDSTVRIAYERQCQAMAAELYREAISGRISWKEAASKANAARNAIMDVMRRQSTPVGLAHAQQHKMVGRTLNELIARKTIETHGPGVNFNDLSPGQKDLIYAKIVKSAGKADAEINVMMRRLSRCGKGLLLLSVALSVYTIANAEDKVDATKREAAVTGAGIGGGVAGGALAGLACGPGAPVCVTVGAFVGGALAAFSVDFLW